MTTKQFKKKTYEAGKDGMISIYPSLLASKEKGKLRRFLKKVLFFKGG